MSKTDKKLLEQIQEKLSTALHEDLEQGVAWMTEEQAKMFKHRYSYLSGAIKEILDME